MLHTGPRRTVRPTTMAGALVWIVIFALNVAGHHGHIVLDNVDTQLMLIPGAVWLVQAVWLGMLLREPPMKSHRAMAVHRKHAARLTLAMLVMQTVGVAACLGIHIVSARNVAILGLVPMVYASLSAFLLWSQSRFMGMVAPSGRQRPR